MTHRPATDWPRTIGVVGAAGTVGSAVAYALAHWGRPERLVMIDPRRSLVTAHALDVQESLYFSSRRRPSLAVADVKDVRGIDLLVIAASHPETPDGDRRTFLTSNWDVLQDIAPHIGRAVGDTGIALLVTNPVDALAQALVRATGIDPSRIIGYTLNDSIRFRAAIARELGVPVSGIDAWVLGEHGSHQVPLFSRVRVRGRHATLSGEARERIAQDVSGWFQRWSDLDVSRSTGWTTSTGLRSLCGRLKTGGLIPACVASRGAYGLSSGFMTLPAIVGPSGVQAVREWAIDADERAALHRAAQAIGEAADHLLQRPLC
jgi:malate/lactate dehydrogenase